jgi:hypothetical protein
MTTTSSVNAVNASFNGPTARYIVDNRDIADARKKLEESEENQIKTRIGHVCRFGEIPQVESRNATSALSPT